MEPSTNPRCQPIPPLAETVNSETTVTEESTKPDVFSSMGTWEDFGKENQIKFTKTKRKKIPRLQEDSQWKEPKICDIELVPNPFRATFSGWKSSEEKKKMQRVCFNPVLSVHYYY
ncbi:Protein CBG20249 [Caenorhabditis briggsae]|uniref:Uncharacterized protein n=2 Tax=Caenorhabditis briggsae TaxID=6238 RepID=A0AAE9E7G2_CAEBR|nr:Protein CBG20249 [Caenorhabditis briggsae]ULU13267.1 hypothetical protein L3Y34_016046 [Caenorhabditis briggsae]UMM14213.1 hypothetical protein L5515_002114 [Caenorhabditis briggsae]CAP37334.1 Protein CBG20249 [Caenorhabditis briggsae]